MANGGVIENGVKMVGEIVLPGASLFLDGDIKAGTGHAAIGLAAWALLGPARFLVSANSFSKSVTDEHLHTHLLGMLNTATTAVSTSVSGLRKGQAGADDAAPDDSAEASAAPA
ncbi:DUF6072 family protein [Candidatus Entotheonella palauensis]|uniref:Uncharacterized protein n=1 Tax=Candidatus Entotheonella gemina TaxID=1429439 RepID=W4L361_9BACT|nr:DUF6072 family protein [Candidatus Entotheonella palauensis]ETW92115.1 MAG: hypothetical protein ETSY2_54475 [Candidatus Entotheonella gemina]